MGKKISAWVMNSKGGVGKTTLAVAIADIMYTMGRPLRAIEIDTRKRLSSFMDEGEVLSFEGAPPISEIRRNPNLVLKHYDPIFSEMERTDCLLDLGANEDPSFIEYCKLSRIDEDLADLEIEVIAFVPTVAEAESLNGALYALTNLREALPSAKRVLVLNEREVGDFDRHLDAARTKALTDEGVVIVRMPRMVSEGWDDFQRAQMRFSDIISTEFTDMQDQFGWTRQFAKRSRGDVAAWFESMRVALSPVLPVGEVE